MFATSAVIFMTQKKAIPTVALPPAPPLKPFPTVGLARFAASARTVSLSWNKHRTRDYETWDMRPAVVPCLVSRSLAS